MPHPDYKKYKLRREDYGNFPHFTDFNDPRFSFSTGLGGQKMRHGICHYYQWLHCVGNWGEEHSMCKKQRWMVERTMHDFWLEKWEEKRKLGHFDYTLLYGAAPWKDFIPIYKPVKKNIKGAYEYWQDRDFEPLWDPECCSWQEKAPILHDIFVKGKKPVFDE